MLLPSALDARKLRGQLGRSRHLRALGSDFRPFDLRWAIVRAALGVLPPYVGGRMRPALIRLAGWDIGHHCMIPDVPMLVGARPGDGRLVVGDGVIFGVQTLFDLAAGVYVGDRAGIGHRVSIITGSHEIGRGIVRLGALRPAPIRIESGAWIGSGAVILGGVTVGEGAIVAAGATVTTDVAPNTVVGGTPARVIREL